MRMVRLPGLGRVPAVRWLALADIARVARATGHASASLCDNEGGACARGAYAANVAEKVGARA